MKFSIASLVLGSLSYASAKNIVQVADDNEDFETLVAAVKAAELVDILRFTTNLTVFAPTNDAFSSLPVGLVKYLLEPGQQDTLTNILWYHVLGVEVNAETAISLAGQSIQTLNNEMIDISLDASSNLFINDAQVIIPDVAADNGIIHAINEVLIPPSFGPIPKDLYDTAEDASIFTTLLAAVDAAGLKDALFKTPGPYTVLAPTDDAFANLPAGTVTSLLADIPALTEILSYHVIEGRVIAAAFAPMLSFTTLNGATVDIATSMGNVMVNNARVTATDIMASNGIVHIIDTVLIPSSDGMNNVENEDEDNNNDMNNDEEEDEEEMNNDEDEDNGNDNDNDNDNDMDNDNDNDNDEDEDGDDVTASKSGVRRRHRRLGQTA